MTLLLTMSMKFYDDSRVVKTAGNIIDESQSVKSRRRHLLAHSVSLTSGDHNRKPLLPRHIPDISIMKLNPFVINPVDNVSKSTDIGNEKLESEIPRFIWIAVKDRSDPLPNHLHTTFQRNKNWRVYVCDNACKDHFIATIFVNTSIAWAYNLINPLVGAAKADIWRYSVLYLFGGLYLDDDRLVSTLCLCLK